MEPNVQFLDPENPQHGKGPDSDWGMKGQLLKGKYPQWSEVGGAPTKDFISYGCLIRGDKLWLYAYQGPTQWYCTNAVPKVSTYDQQNPFAECPRFC